jgi:hypothetical protein
LTISSTFFFLSEYYRSNKFNKLSVAFVKIVILPPSIVNPRLTLHQRRLSRPHALSGTSAGHCSGSIFGSLPTPYRCWRPRQSPTEAKNSLNPATCGCLPARYSTVRRKPLFEGDLRRPAQLLLRLTGIQVDPISPPPTTPATRPVVRKNATDKIETESDLHQAGRQRSSGK